jgi:indole-3-pyruvate monooxygenase
VPPWAAESCARWPAPPYHGLRPVVPEILPMPDPVTPPKDPVSLPATTDVVVVGAGPAGLACAACLTRAGVSHVLVERKTEVASAWRGHYDRLHLHTSRGYSQLPFYPMPRAYPRYPSRDQVVAYLERYVERLGLEPELGVEVRRLDPRGEGWSVQTSRGSLACRHVVVATGVNGEPNLPTWPGSETFPGPVVHSSAYTNGRELAGRRVLVVGFGNSGGEIALDLLEHGARPAVSIRGPVNVIPRDILGIPVLAIAIPLSRLPPRVADALVWPLLKLYYPSYARLGLRKAKLGPFRQIAVRNKVPLLDIGTTRAMRRGAIDVTGEIEGMHGARVSFRDGAAAEFDAIVLATGFRPRVPAGLDGDQAGSDARKANLHYCGFYVASTGMLREIGIEARRITADVVASLSR